MARLSKLNRVTTPSPVSLAEGGTGQTSQTAAFNALAPSVAKGDLIVYNGADNVRLAVGANDQVLTADSTAAGGAMPEIKTPTNVSPGPGATGIDPSATLTGTPYYSLYGVPMAAAQWQVSTVSDFSSTVVNTGDVAGTSVTYAVTPGVLSFSTPYYWRVRYKDNNGVYSACSTGTSFTTAAISPPAGIGAAYQGGYYAGKIVQNGTEYYLIVAPKSSGEISNKQWKTSGTSTPGTSSVIDGPTNSANMNNSSHPAAQFCEGLTIGGSTDWYMPARNELEVCYYNLKPTTTSNNTSSGANPNAVPSRGSNYTSSVPGQTSVTAFKSGGSEAFVASYYWASTEISSNTAELPSFDDGNQYYPFRSKFDPNYVRAVRRVPVS